MTTIAEALRKLKVSDLDLYINEDLMLETKADDIYNKYYSDIDREIFDQIWNADPTSTPEIRGKYVPWLLARYKKGEEVLPNLSKITKCLNLFNGDKAKFSTALGTNDINSVSIEQFISTVENTDKSAFRQYLENTGNVVTIASSKNYDVFHPLNFEGNSAIVGKANTKDPNHDLNWCTGYAGDDSYFNRYGKDYYCFILKKDRKDKNNCYQINIVDGDIQHFLNGHDSRPGNGGENPKEEFIIFLLSEPDLIEELAQSPLYNKCKSLKQAYTVMKEMQEAKPFIYKGEFVVHYPVKYYKNIMKAVDIEEGVKVIKPGVFAGCSNLQTVKFSDSVEVVSARAFANCTSLSSLTLNEGLKEIKSLAFLGDTSLRRVDIPDSLQKLSINAFRDCSDVILRVKNPDGKRYIEIEDNLTEEDYRWIRKHVKQVKSDN